MANEFKIKNGVIVNNTIPVTGISDTLTSASDQLTTSNAIKTYIDESISDISTSAVQFDTGVVYSSEFLTSGFMAWDSEHRTISIGMGDGVVLQLGQEQLNHVRNNTGSTITNGTPVMFAGTLGNSGRLLIQPAIADGSIPSEYILGVATQDILNGEDGCVTSYGSVRGIDTTGSLYGEVWNDGDILYVSPNTAGYLTKVKPDAPNAIITLAAVIHASSNGSLVVRPSWQQLLTDLSDVNGTPLTETGQILVWDNDNNYFDFSDNINNYTTSSDFDSHTGDVTIHFTKESIDGLVTSAGNSGQVLMKNSNTDYDYDWATLPGGGDMLKATYDTNDNGIVDNSESLGGNLPEYFATSADLVSHTGDTSIHFTEASLNLNQYSTSADLNSHTSDTSIHFTQGAISITASQVSDFDTEVSNNTAVAANTAKVSADGSVTTHNDVTDAGSGSIITTLERNKLNNIEAGAEVNNISDINAVDLTNGGESTLHYHASDRDRSNHTGTQTASTISDFDTEVSNNSSVTANTSHRGDASIHFTEASLDLQQYATSADLNSHTSDSSIHFTEASIDHTAIANVGSNTHAQIDTHITEYNTHTHSGDGGGTISSIDVFYSSATSQLPSTNVKGAIDELDSIVDSHTGDSTIHFTQGSISITASQVSDLKTVDGNSLGGGGDIELLTRTTNSAYDWDTIVDAGVYRGNGSATNGPTGYNGFESVFVYTPNGTTYIAQTAIDGTGDSIATRRSNDSGASWSAWEIFAKDSDLTTHTGDSTIHFTQGSISITASQVSDFDTEVANNSAVAANTAKVTNATHTGDVTGSTTLTIANDAVSNTKLANMAQSTIKGRASGAGTGDPTDLTASQVRTIIGNTTAQWNANLLQGRTIATTAPSDGQVLTYDTTNGWQPETPSGGGGGNTTRYVATYQPNGQGGDSAWSANTDYEYTITVTGASVGDTVVINPDSALYSSIHSASVNFSYYGYVVSSNTVRINVRTTGYVSIGSTETLRITVLTS